MFQQRQIQTRLQQLRESQAASNTNTTTSTAVGLGRNRSAAAASNKAETTKPVTALLRKRKALGDVSNQIPQVSAQEVKKPLTKTQVRSKRASLKSSVAPQTEAAKPEEKKKSVTAKAKKGVEQEQEQQKKTKKVKESTVVVVPTVEDLDASDSDDPLMVSEYVKEIFEYLRELEMKTIPVNDFMDTVQKELTWKMRTILLDWLVEVHAKFRLLPETLFLTVNIIDRFLSVRSVSVGKLQLVGITAMFLASKYEEVYAPSISQFAYITDNGFTTEDICKAERYMLSSLDFGLHFPNPLHFLRRASKADQYDPNSRTMAKYFLEVAMLHKEFSIYQPSLLSAAFLYTARIVMGKQNAWNVTFQYYCGGYELEDIVPVAKKLVNRLKEETAYKSIYTKYASSKYSRISVYAEQWAKERSASIYNDLLKKNDAKQEWQKEEDEEE